MKQGLWIVSLLTLGVLGAAIVGQALVVLIGVDYQPDGIPVDPTTPALIAGGLAGVGGLLALPLAVAAFTVGLVATAQEKQYGWLTAMIGAGLLATVGLLGMAWVLLSSSSPVAFQTPLVVIPFVIVLYLLLSRTRRVAVSVVSH